MSQTRYRRQILFGVHTRFSRKFCLFLSSLLIALLVLVYFVASEMRHAENPNDKLLPTFSKMINSTYETTFTKDQRTGKYLLWSDTLASLSIIGKGIALSALIGLFLGLNMGIFPVAKETLLYFITFASIIPPTAILVIIFVVFGVDELAKIVLIIFGTCPFITRDIYQTVRKIPPETIVKVETLGASRLGIVYRVVLPLVMPKFLDTIRLCLGAVWLFLIAAEAIAATQGLGYRIYLVRRYLAMDIIIPYVLWITFLAYCFDWMLAKLICLKFPWYNADEAK